MHIGINTELVVAGGLGSTSRQYYSVMGDAVNIAARLESAASNGQIYVGPTTYHLTNHIFQFYPLTPLELKGKSNPLQAYQLVQHKKEVTEKKRS